MENGDFLRCKNWVVVGDVLDESKYAARIKRELENAGYRVTGVHPKGGGENGVRARLADVDDGVEIIDLCINPRSGLEYMREAAELGLDKVLVQPGAASPELLDFCRNNGIDAREGCALVLLAENGNTPLGG